MTRCNWSTTSDLMIRYHDEEWGVTVHDDRKLFEYMVLDSAQAGLSWETILKKRDNYRRAFDNFDPDVIAKYGQEEVESLMQDAGIIRNRRKIESAVQNAKAFLEIQREFGSFAAYIWQFVGGKPKVNAWRSIKEIPASTPESDAMSQDLKKRGFSFVGTTICYAFMQAAGLVNDHATDCFRYRQIIDMAK